MCVLCSSCARMCACLRLCVCVLVCRCRQYQYCYLSCAHAVYRPGTSSAVLLLPQPPPHRRSNGNVATASASQLCVYVCVLLSAFINRFAFIFFLYFVAFILIISIFDAIFGIVASHRRIGMYVKLNELYVCMW